MFSGLQAVSERLFKSQNIIAQAMRYCLSGGLIYLIDLLVFLLLHYVLFLEPYSANIVAKLTGAVSGFFLHRTFTFSVASGKPGRAQMVRYAGLWLVNVTAANAFLYGALSALAMPVFWGKIISDILVILMSFIVSKYFIFK